MVLIPSNLTVSSISNNATGLKLNQLLQVGQVLSAKIQPISNEQVKITIGNQTLVASTKQPISESGNVQVKVNKLLPEIQLSIVSNKTSTANQQTTQTIQNAYRQFIPMQGSISNSFQQISLMQSLPPSIQAPVSQLLSLVNKQDIQQLTGKELKQRLINSGLFLESKLKNHAPSQDIKQDLKAQLLQLQQLTNQAQLTQNSRSLNKLSQALNQALSRLTVQQVQLYENPNLTPLELFHEHEHRVLEDYIEIHKQVYQGQNQWQVFIELQLDKAEFSAKLSLINEEQLHCALWCSDAELQEKMSAQVEQLKSLLSDQGLSQLNIQMAAKKPSKPQQSQRVALIDIKI